MMTMNTKRGRRKKFRFDADEIRELYWDHNLTLEQIGQSFGCTAPTVRNFMIEAGIPTRPKQGTKRDPYITTINLKRLEHFYLKEGLSVDEIAAKFFCSKSTIYNRLSQAGLNKRKA